MRQELVRARSAWLMRGILTGCLLLRVSVAQDREWPGLLARGQELQAQGRYAEAESTFQSALDQSSDPLAVAQSLNRLGFSKQIRGDYSAAESLFQKASNGLGYAANALVDWHQLQRR